MSLLLNQIRSEWFKLTRRPLAWGLLAVLLALLVLVRATEFIAVVFQEGLLTNGEVRMTLLPPENIAQFKLQLMFPGVFGATLGHMNSVGGICAIVLAAGAVGSDYSWGTLRVQLARQPNRASYLLAKLIALQLVLLGGLLICLAVGAIIALVFGSLLGATGSLGTADLALLPAGVARAMYVMLPYVMFTVACCVVGRSVLAGAAGGFLFLVLDIGLGTLSFLGKLGGMLAWITSLFIQANINTLVVLNSRSFGLDPLVFTSSLDPATLPSPLQATVVVGVWSLLFFLYAYYTLTRSDITGAA